MYDILTLMYEFGFGFSYIGLFKGSRPGVHCTCWRPGFDLQVLFIVVHGYGSIFHQIHSILNSTYTYPNLKVNWLESIIGVAFQDFDACGCICLYLKRIFKKYSSFDKMCTDLQMED